MVSQTCCHHADFRDLHSIVVLVRIFVVGSVFSGPMALAIDSADLLIAWAAPSSIRRKTGLPLVAQTDLPRCPQFGRYRGRADVVVFLRLCG